MVDRLGEAFFRQLPEAPGVYLMSGVDEAALHVGTARNLRHRLSSYRVANPDRLPRRLLRLLHRIERIAWEICEDEAAALQREAELLLSLKPRFNRAGVWPKPRRFLAWRVRPDGLEPTVTEWPEPDWRWAGPSGAQMAHIHRALVRLLWCQLQPQRGLAGMPAGWFDGAHGPQVLIPQSSAAPANARAEFLALLTDGDCESVQPRLVPASNAFERLAYDADWTLVSEHFGRPAQCVPGPNIPGTAAPEKERVALHNAPAARDFERAVLGPFRYTVRQHPEGTEGRRA